MQEMQVQSMGQKASPRGGNGSSLQYSYLENSMDRGAWWAESMGLQRVWHGWAEQLSRHTLVPSRFSINIWWMKNMKEEREGSCWGSSRRELWRTPGRWIWRVAKTFQSFLKASFNLGNIILFIVNCSVLLTESVDGEKILYWLSATVV